MENLKLVYFGGEPIGVPVLEELKACGITPSLVVCNPDRPQGRKQVLTPPPVKVWAEAMGIPVFQPESVKDKEALGPLLAETFDLFVVVAYAQIMPKWLIETPKHGTLNVHPSLLPKLRGMSPIRTTILEDMKDEVGVTIMQMDEEMDHGPIVAQEKTLIASQNWPLPGAHLDLALARQGGAMLASIIPDWMTGAITPTEQNHATATFSKKITKDMGELTIDPHNLPTGDGARQILLKIMAFEGWPGTFFFHNKKRIKITEARLDDSGSLVLVSVIPEGKTEMDFVDWLER